MLCNSALLPLVRSAFVVSSSSTARRNNWPWIARQRVSLFHNNRSTQSTSSLTVRAMSTTNQTPNNNNSNLSDGDKLFGKFVIPAASIFYQSTQNQQQSSFAFVNLRPIVQGHVLVCPTTIVPHLHELSYEEYTDLWKTVRVVQAILKETYPDTTAFNVAVQDGAAAGQSVPHVHVHILPRAAGDFERSDDVYDALQAWAPRPELESTVTLEVLPDEARQDRTRQQMADEAALYRQATAAQETDAA